MARPLDPFRALEVSRDATLDEVKASYRRLAKLYHPDSAGDRALPRFLAIQAAYEALTEGPAALRLGRNPRPRPAGGRPTRASEADTERARATREAAGRGGRTRPSAGGSAGPAGRTGSAGTTGYAGATGYAGTTGNASKNGNAGTNGAGTTGANNRGSRTSDGADRGAPGGSSGSAGTGGARTGAGRSGSGSTGRIRRDRRTPSSTSYDGADLEPFEPEWQGASWYGESSGTYWTINAKEFADPRKHGPEYQARGRRAAPSERTGTSTTGPGGPTRRASASARGVPRDSDTNVTEPTPEQPSAATADADPPASADRTSALLPTAEPGTFRSPRPESVAWTRPIVPPVSPAPGAARPPFAVFGVFAILMGAIGTILILSPAGPASASFVPVIFLVAILAAAGLVLGGLRGGRRA